MMRQDHHLYLVLEHAYPPKGDPVPISHPAFPPPDPGGRLIHFLRMGLPVLEVSYLWDHTPHVLVPPTSLTSLVSSKSLHGASV